MDKISLLQQRKQQLLKAGENIRKEIGELIDENSFVELSSFSFSSGEFYDDGAQGEGVVTGFATVNDYPFYIVAQNFDVCSGGVSKANCEKIEKCISQAEKSATPVIWILSSLGVRVGEGVNVLEGIAKLILRCSQLKGSVPQFLVVDGEVYGQISVLAGICDFVYFIDKKSVLSYASPLVVSAGSGKNLQKAQVGGAEALKHANIATFTVKDFKEIKESITAVSEILAEPVLAYDNLNETFDSLDKEAKPQKILEIFDEGYIELGSSFAPEVKCILGRIGGIAVASAVFMREEGTELTFQTVRKLKDFAEFASCNNLPYVTFVNTLGIKADLPTADSLVLKEIGDYVSILDCIDSAKISVIYGKAVGLGYTLFAAKSMGYDYSYAFANAKIALFDGAEGAEVEFYGQKADREKLAKRYAEENSDPVNAAKGGYIDDIIRPSTVKQYLIASLQMLLK